MNGCDLTDRERFANTPYSNQMSHCQALYRFEDKLNETEEGCTWSRRDSVKCCTGFRSMWHRSAWKSPYRLSLTSPQSPQVWTQNSTNVWLAAGRFRSQRVERWAPLCFTPLSFLRSMLECSDLSMFRKVLKPSSTSAL